QHEVGEETKMEQHPLVRRNKFLTSEARSSGEMAQALEDAARQLRPMEQDGISLDPESGVEDDHALLVTTDPKVARKYDFEEEADPKVKDTGHLNSGTRHRQVWVEWDGYGADVDEELAPLILALWKKGIVTCNSCQENRPGIAWVEFLTARDA